MGIKLDQIYFGDNAPFVLIAGVCAIENRKDTLQIAKAIKQITKKVGIPFIFKGSFDKANRTSHESFRGVGLKEGLKILREVKKKLNIPVLTDVHSVQQIRTVAKSVDIIQIPAFLCRQTDLLIEAGKTKKIINVKKGQFVHPYCMSYAVKKIQSTGNKRILLTERGTFFGYNNLVSDFRSIDMMKETGSPVIFDGTHSVQEPSGYGCTTSGKRKHIPLLCRCAVASGVSGIYLEVHPNPEDALSDGANTLRLDELENLLTQLKTIDKVIKNEVQR